MDQFKRTTAPQTSAVADLPPHRRNPQRITVTISWRLHQKLIDRSDMEGRSLSNLAAHLLEVSCCRSLTTSSVGQPEAQLRWPMAPSPNPFWAEVRAQATAGALIVVITAICGGLGYLIHTVPRQLDQVLDNQQTFRNRMDTVERKVENQGERLIRLEARP